MTCCQFLCENLKKWRICYFPGNRSSMLLHLQTLFPIWTGLDPECSHWSCFVWLKSCLIFRIFSLARHLYKSVIFLCYTKQVSSLSALVRHLLYFSVLFFSCQAAWVIFHSLLKNINIRTSATVFELDFPLSETVAKSPFYSIHFFHGYTNNTFVIFVTACCWELTLNSLTFRVTDLSWVSAFQCTTTSLYFPFPIFLYGLQSTFIDFMLLGVCGKAHFDWVGTANEGTGHSEWFIYQHVTMLLILFISFYLQ